MHLHLVLGAFDRVDPLWRECWPVDRVGGGGPEGFLPPS